MNIEVKNINIKSEKSVDFFFEHFIKSKENIILISESIYIMRIHYK